MSATVVLVVDAGDETWSIVRSCCVSVGMIAQHVHDAHNAMILVERGMPISLIIANRTLRDRDGLAFVADVRRLRSDILIAVVCETRDLAVIDAGADLVLLQPIDEHVIRNTVQAAIAMPSDDDLPALKLRLLIVESDPHLAVVMQRWLSDIYDVTLVTTAWRAVQEIDRARYDVVLAELRLPDMEPQELLASIEQTVPSLGARTLFMTAGFIADRAQQFLATIPGQWIEQPFDLARLREALASLLAE